MFAKLFIQKFIKKASTSYFIPFLLLLCSSCAKQKSAKKYRIGFSQCQSGDAWRQTMLGEMKRELSFHENIEKKQL